MSIARSYVIVGGLGAAALCLGIAGCGDDTGGTGTGGGTGSSTTSSDAATTASTGTTTGAGGGEGGGGGSGYVPQEGELAFESPTYSLEGGEEVNYWCFTFELPEGDPTIVREIEPIYGQAIHHVGVFQTLVPEPEGAFECEELVRETWVPLYGGGVESGRLTMPEGAGMEMRPGQQILVQLHLLNATPDTVEDTATVVLRTTDEQDPTPAGMFGLDKRDLEIPPSSSDVVQTISCSPGREMDVFAVFGHMHQRGTHIELSRGDVPGEEVLYEADWAFEEQPTVPASFHLGADDQIHITCTYDNTTSETLGYGESTFDEMCSFAIYYTPFDELDGCVQLP